LRHGTRGPGQTQPTTRTCAGLARWRTAPASPAGCPDRTTRAEPGRANLRRQDRDARPGATAPPALPAPNNSPASPSATVTGNGKPSRPWPDVWPTTSSSPSSPTPPSATVGPGAYTPSPVPPPTPPTT